MEISLTKDFIKQPAEVIIDNEKVGRVAMKDVGLTDSLKDFYTRNYRPDYILSHQPLFDWMFKNNGGRVAVLEYDNKVIAHQGHVPIVFTTGENDYRGFISVSTMVDEDFRRKGLMTALRGSVQNRYDMACSIGGSAEGVALYKTMGYQLYGDLKRMAAIVDLEKSKEIAQEPDKLQLTLQISQKESTDVKEIENFDKISDQVDDLIDKIFKPGTFFGVKRNAEFYDWRYTDHPVYKYHRFGLFKKGILQALIVFRREEIPDLETAVIRITEVIGEEKDIEELVKNSVLTPEVLTGIGWVDFFCSNKKICQSLKGAGFVPEKDLPTRLPIFCNPVDYYKIKYPVMVWSKDESIHEALPEFDSWYFTKGDGDADRPNKLLK